MKTIIFDWDGTIARKEIATEAALRRAKSLGIIESLESLNEKQKTHSHYVDAKKAIRSHVGNLDENIITEIMTNFFQYHYLAVVNEEPEKVFYENINETLMKLKNNGFKLIIASTLRYDILEPVLKKLKPKLFDEIFANTPDLEHSKEYLVDKACKKYDSILIIGDREEDINAGKKQGLKTIMVDWGYAKDKKQNGANYFITKPEQLLEIIK